MAKRVQNFALSQIDEYVTYLMENNKLSSRLANWLITGSSINDFDAP